MLAVKHSPAHFVLFHFLLQLCFNFKQLSQLQECPVPLKFPLPHVITTMDAMSSHWVFYFQGSSLPLPFCGTWSSYVYNVYIALQDYRLLI